VAWVLAGKPSRTGQGAPASGPYLFEVKGAVDLALRAAGFPAQEWNPSPLPFLSPLRAARIGPALGRVGWAGELAPEILAAWGLEVSAYAAEISLAKLAENSEAARWRHTPLARTPSVSRDLSLLLDEGIAYSELEATLRAVEGVPVASVRLFDRYQGPPVPNGKVSLALTVIFQAPGRTLVSEEVSQYLDRIVQRLRERLGAVLRGN
jgi:phenylalanyl-tRNA synthetase beta chain